MQRHRREDGKVEHKIKNRSNRGKKFYISRERHKEALNTLTGQQELLLDETTREQLQNTPLLLSVINSLTAPALPNSEKNEANGW